LLDRVKKKCYSRKYCCVR